MGRASFTMGALSAGAERPSLLPFHQGVHRMKSFAIGLVAAVLASTVPLATLAAGPSPATPAATPFTVGKLSLVSLSDAKFVLANDGKTFGVDAGVDKVTAVLKAAHASTDEI